MSKHIPKSHIQHFKFHVKFCILKHEIIPFLSSKSLLNYEHSVQAARMDPVYGSHEFLGTGGILHPCNLMTPIFWCSVADLIRTNCNPGKPRQAAIAMPRFHASRSVSPSFGPGRSRLSDLWVHGFCHAAVKC